MHAACLFTALTLAGAAAAKPTPDSTLVRSAPFYIGVQVGSYRFAGLGQTDINGKRLSYRGPMPVLGARLSKRSGLEISAMWRKATDGPLTVIDYPNGGQYRYYDTYQSRVIPVLYRYAFLANPRRWNVEGIIGFSLVHSRIEGHRSMTEPGQPEQPFEVGGSTEANDLPLALGAAVAYTPTRHWTLVGEGRLNWPIMGSAAAAVLFSRVFLPQTGASVGLRYNFGLGK